MSLVVNKPLGKLLFERHYRGDDRYVFIPGGKDFVIKQISICFDRKHNDIPYGLISTLNDILGLLSVQDLPYTPKLLDFQMNLKQIKPTFSFTMPIYKEIAPLFNKLLDDNDIATVRHLFKKWFIQLLYLLKAFRSRHLKHGDLKIHNMLIDENLDLVLIDYGQMCRGYKKNDDLDDYITQSIPYVPPEFRGENVWIGNGVKCISYYEKYHNSLAHANRTKTEIYSLGMVLIALSLGIDNFMIKSNNGTCDQIIPPKDEMNEVLYKIFDHWDKLGGLTNKRPRVVSRLKKEKEALINLVKGMLEISVQDRFGLDDVFAHEFVRVYCKDELKKYHFDCDDTTLFKKSVLRDIFERFPHIDLYHEDNKRVILGALFARGYDHPCNHIPNESICKFVYQIYEQYKQMH
jgi:serine/threonine protein kinase